MKIEFELSHKGQKAHMRVRWEDVDKLIWWSYDLPDVKLDERSMAFLPLPVLIGLFGTARQEHYEVEIRGVALTEQDIKVYAYVLRERYPASWDKLGPNGPQLELKGIPFKMPKWSLKCAVANDTPPNSPETNTVCTSFSFGKESQFIRRMAKDIFPGANVVPNFIEHSKYGSAAVRPHYARYPDLLVTRSNINHIAGILQKKYRDVIPHFFYPFMHAPALMPIAKTYGVRHWMMGNEIDVSWRVPVGPERTCGEPEFHYRIFTFDETLLYEWIHTLMMQSIVHPDAKWWSPICATWEIKQVEILLRHYKMPLTDILACWQMGPSTWWCGECGKCLRYFCMLIMLGINPPFRLTHGWAKRPTPGDTAYPPTAGVPWSEGGIFDPNKAELYKIMGNPDRVNELDHFYVDKLQYMPASVRDKVCEFFAPWVEFVEGNPFPLDHSDLNLDRGLACVTDIEPIL